MGRIEKSEAVTLKLSSLISCGLNHIKRKFDYRKLKLFNPNTMKKLKVILAILFIANLPFNGYSQGSGAEVIKPPKYPNGVYTKENSAHRRAIPYTSLREADVMWAKRVWRVIPLKEKINHPLYYPTQPIADRKSLFEVLRDGAIKNGTITCFNSTDDEFRIEFTKSEIEGMLVSWDSSAQTEDPNNPGQYISAPVKNEINSEKNFKILG